MELGVFSLSDIDVGRGATPQSRIKDTIDYGVAAESAGLDVFGVGEHHTHQYAVSSPAVVLAAVAARTSRVKLTSTATVLSVLDPVRVYQDFATLDLVSNGRAEIIAGRSAFTEPFELFGYDITQFNELFAEKLDLLLAIREKPTLSWSGEFRPPLRDGEVNPRALSHLPIWAAVGGTPQSAVRAGTLGLPLALGLIGGSYEYAKRLIDLYKTVGMQSGYDDAGLKVGITSHFYVGERGTDAVSDIFPHYRDYLSPASNRGRGFHVTESQMRDGAQRGQALMVGNADQVTTKIQDLRNQLGVDRFLGQIDFGGIPKEKVLASIERLGSEVAPEVRTQL